MLLYMGLDGISIKEHLVDLSNRESIWSPLSDDDGLPHPKPKLAEASEVRELLRSKYRVSLRVPSHRLVNLRL
jgi:hypothetical protein